MIVKKLKINAKLAPDINNKGIVLKESICKKTNPAIKGRGIIAEDNAKDNLSFLLAIIFLNWLTANIIIKKEMLILRISWLKSYLVNITSQAKTRNSKFNKFIIITKRAAAKLMRIDMKLALAMLIWRISLEYKAFIGCIKTISTTMASFHIKSYDPSVSIEKILATKILSKEKISIKAKELKKYDEALNKDWKNDFKLVILMTLISDNLSNLRATAIGLAKMLILATTRAQA